MREPLSESCHRGVSVQTALDLRRRARIGKERAESRKSAMDTLNYHPYDISMRDLLKDSDSESEVKPRLVCDEMSGPQEEVDLVETEAEGSEVKSKAPKRKKSLSRKKMKINKSRVNKKKRGVEKNHEEENDERGERRKRRAGVDDCSWLEPVKKKMKRVRNQEDGEKVEERCELEQVVEESWKGKEDKCVQFEPTEGNPQMWRKDCKVTIGNLCNYHDP